MEGRYIHTDVDAKYELQPGTAKKLRGAMNQTWQGISSDCDDSQATLKLYRKRGEKPPASWEELEDRMITELTIDAGRIDMYGFSPKEDRSWWDAIKERHDIMKLAKDAYSARSRLQVGDVRLCHPAGGADDYLATVRTVEPLTFVDANGTILAESDMIGHGPVPEKRAKKTR